jgi:hypothetical protein
MQEFYIKRINSNGYPEYLHVDDDNNLTWKGKRYASRFLGYEAKFYASRETTGECVIEPA